MKCIKDIDGFEPKAFWKNFDKILSIPHPSGYEQELVEYLKEFSDGLGLKYVVDSVGNILIKKPATLKKKNSPVVVLQAHLDMVPQKNRGTEHDFLKDSISAYVEDGWVKANGTTLGADNGTGVASIMSILEDKTIEHGPIEALLTIEEEVGLRGAGNLKPGILTGKYMINLDCGPDDNFIIGCAGGVNSEIIFDYNRDEINDLDKYTFIKLSVKGLKGGHSSDVLRQKGNANKILFRILYSLNKKFKIRISDIDSGGLRNAIPREGSVVFSFDKSKEKELIKNIYAELENIKNELKTSDSDLYVEIENTSKPDFVIDIKSQNAIISSIHACQIGLIRMSDEMTETIETSTNMASVKLEKEKSEIKIVFMTRSTMLSQKDLFCDKIDALFKLAGAAEVKHLGGYPGWLPNTQSELLDIAVDVYKRMFNALPVQKVVHGGLECGIIGDVYPEMEMLAIGPNAEGAHSPDEKLEIVSMKKNYDFLIELLAAL